MRQPLSIRVLYPDDTVIYLPDDLPDPAPYEAVKSIVRGYIDGWPEHVRVFSQAGVWFVSMFVDEDGIKKGLKLNRLATEEDHRNTKIHRPQVYESYTKHHPIYGVAVLFDRNVYEYPDAENNDDDA